MISIHDFTVPKVSEESHKSQPKVEIYFWDASNH